MKKYIKKQTHNNTSLLSLIICISLIIGMIQVGMITNTASASVRVNIEKTTDSKKVVKVALGMDHSAAISDDGDLYMWGSNNHGQLGDGTLSDKPYPVRVMQNVKEVSLGWAYSAAITEDGDLYMWGRCGFQRGDNDEEDHLMPVKVLDNVRSVALNMSHSAAVAENGDLYMWGYNDYGQLGDGTDTGHSTPVKILENVKEISLGDAHSAAVTEDGSLYCWGRGIYGQLGLGDGFGKNCNTPVKALENVKTVSLGNECGAAIMENGDLYTWGNSNDGRLGRKNISPGTCYGTPLKIMSNITEVSMFNKHGGAIDKSGNLYTWGDNASGQIGNGLTENCLTPVKIMDNAGSVSIGGSHSAVISSDGSLLCWGGNRYGQVGNLYSNRQYEPVEIMGGIRDVSLGNGSSAAVTDKGILYCWGNNDHGQLGNASTVNSNTPVRILGGIKKAALGDGFSAALAENGNLYMWGKNDHGQLGDGTTKDRYIPVKIMSGIVDVAVGYDHSAAIDTDGKLYIWGGNGHGQLGNGTQSEAHVPVCVLENIHKISLGNAFSAAVTEEGELYTWGWNNYGQLGNDTQTDSNTPVKILESIKDVSLGNAHTAVITQENDLLMWGNNWQGQLGRGNSSGCQLKPEKAVLNKVAKVSLGVAHSAAITENGDLYMWGSNWSGRFGGVEETVGSNVPVKIYGADDISIDFIKMSGNHDAFITKDGRLFIWGNDDCGQVGDGMSLRRYPVIPENIFNKTVDYYSIDSSSSNNVSKTQKVDFVISDRTDLSGSVDVAGYYWGTSDSYSENEYYNAAEVVNNNRIGVSAVVAEEGTYSLVLKDKEDNISSPYKLTFYKTILDANGGTVSPEYIITEAANIISLPVPEREGHTFIGWTDNINGMGSITNYLFASGNGTYHALWVEDPEPVSTPEPTEEPISTEEPEESLILLGNYEPAATSVPAKLTLSPMQGSDNVLESYENSASKKPSPLIKKGLKFYSGNLRYKVTSAKNKCYEVKVVGVKNKKNSSITIEGDVEYNDIQFKVTAIGKSFAAGCTRLKTINIKSKHIKTIEKKAFAGIKSKYTIYVVKSKLKKYTKMLKKAK